MALEQIKKRVLITGASGLVGNGVRWAVKQDEKLSKMYDFYYVSSQDAHLQIREETDRLFNSIKPDYVIHLAAHVGGLFANMQDNLQFFLNNMHINENVLANAYEHQVIKCISCLSTCIFPDKTTYPINESMVHLGPPHNSNFGYSYAKRMVDVLNHAYNEKMNKEEQEQPRLFTAVIPTNVYGMHDNFKPESAHVIPALIRRAYIEARKCEELGTKNAELIVYGSGKPLRQFIFSHDLGRLILWTLQEYQEEQPIILSVDEQDEISIGDAAKYIVLAFEQLLGIKFKLQFDTSFADGQFKKTADNSKLRSKLKEFNFTPFEEGIRKTVKWFYETSKAAEVK